MAACAPALGAAADPPRITDAGMSPRRFAVDRTGPSELQAAAARGSTFHYDLSKQAEVFFFLDRGTRGRVVGGHCRRETRRNRRHHRYCVRYVRSGSFKQSAKAGANVKPFSGRIGKHTLKPAHYKATLVAVDSMGNPSTPGKVLRFTLLRG